MLDEMRKLHVFAFNKGDHFGVGNLEMATRKEARRSCVLI